MITSVKDKLNKVVLVVFIPAGIVFVLSQILINNHHLSLEKNDAESLLLTLCRYENESLVNAIEKSRMTDLKKHAESISKISGVLAVRIYNENGFLLVSSDDNVYKQKQEFFFSKEKKSTEAEYSGIACIDYQYEIKTGEKNSGFIRIFYSIERNIRYRIYSLIACLLLMTLVACITIYYLNKKINNIIITPVMQLNSAMRKTDSLNAESSILSYSDDEIGELVTSFNELIERFYTMIADNEIIIDEYRSISEAFRKSEEDLHVTLYSIADGVISTDSEGVIVRINEAALKIMGYNEKEAVGKPLCEIFGGLDDNDRVLKTFQQVCDAADDIAKKVSIRDKNNKTVFVSANGAVIKDDDGNVIGSVIVFRDITEQIKAEEKLRQSQKMDAVGQLAGGIAHDFNNMLSAIIGAAQLMQMSIDDREELETCIELIQSTCLKTSKLTKRLLDFSRKGNVKIETVDVSSVISSTVQLLKRSIDKRIEIIIEFRDDELYCQFDNAQLENILLNLGLNAKDAMPEGGILKYSTGMTVLDADFCVSSGFDVHPGDYIVISCSDNGCGMTEDVMEHIFEPFFTTKEPGKGTGLGLASVYGIIKDYNGIIKVSSVPGEGTVFNIYIPVAGKVNINNNEGTVSGEIQSKTILLADDEEIVQKVLKMLLEKLGHRVISVYNGFDAVDVYRKLWKNIDVVILDMMMPGLNGRDAYFLLLDINSGLKVVISSGFSKDESSIALLKEKNVRGFLQKPYSIYDLKKLLLEIFNDNINS